MKQLRLDRAKHPVLWWAAFPAWVVGATALMHYFGTFPWPLAVMWTGAMCVWLLVLYPTYRQRRYPTRANASSAKPKRR